MSYCRWSTDDYRCDLYVYDTAYDCTEVHIAKYRRKIPDDELPPPVDLLEEGSDEEAVRRFVDRHEKVMALLNDCPIEEIGGPYDGLSQCFDTTDDAADWIEQNLVPIGIYNFPDDLIQNMREGNG